MKKKLQWIVASITGLLLTATNVVAIDSEPVKTTGINEERSHSLRISGWIQPRYQYSSEYGASEDLSSFYIRRARIDVQGHVFSEQLTYRILSEFARTANLRDAWMNYAFSRNLQIRFGQFTVPFQWHRYVSPRRQHFAERGVPSETFGFPDGRDIGFMVHGRNSERNFHYQVGVFDGFGRNQQFSNSNGHMLSGRLTYAPLGQVPGDETDYLRSTTPNLSFGVGAQTGIKNEVRQWDLGRSKDNNRRADFFTTTGDVHFAYMGFSIVADAQMRFVWPDDEDLSNYDGSGYMISAGYTLIPGKLDVVGRYSNLYLDNDMENTRRGEWGAGINIYHNGHDSKTRVQYLSNGRHLAGEFGWGGSLIVEYHIQF